MTSRQGCTFYATPGYVLPTSHRLEDLIARQKLFDDGAKLRAAAR